MTRYCQGLNCTSVALIKAHIIPRGFARIAQGDGKIIAIESNRAPAVAKYQHGFFDSSILCASCDTNLGCFDDYAIEFCKRFPERCQPYSDLGFQVQNVDTDLLRKGILAILWRASISTRPECAHISLGLYEKKARDVLFNARSLDQFPEFQVVLQQYVAPYARSIDFVTLPDRRKFDGLNVYLFGLVGLRFLVKMDARPFPLVMREWVISGMRRVIGTKIAFEEASEGRALLNTAKFYKGYRDGK